MIVENQENLSIQSLEQKEIEKLELDLIKAKQRVATIENKISFRPKGKSSKWTEELIKARNVVQNIVNRINLLKRIEDDKLTEAFLKDYDEKNKINEEERALAEEQKKALALFNEYKENTITKPELKLTPRPDFTEVGIKWKQDRNLQEKLKTAQKLFDSTNLRAKSSSPVGKSGRTAQLQKARDELASALKSVEKEAGNVEFYTLRAEVEWKETVIAEREAYSLELQAYIDKTEKDLALFEKHGLIEPEIKK